MSRLVRLNDVGPRDGLQNQSVGLDPVQRVDLIRALLGAGVRYIEVGSFVSPRAVPAMVGTDRVLAELKTDPGEFSVLVPNMKGYELARDAGAKCVGMVLYGTESMARGECEHGTGRCRRHRGADTAKVCRSWYPGRGNDFGCLGVSF